ncbi:MAG: hypothetical protein KF777_15120 [Planctomycetaceae bacterium]|nr:hypothetical protein [Planctomycetaceae bacterium]
MGDIADGLRIGLRDCRSARLAAVPVVLICVYGISMVGCSTSTNEIDDVEKGSVVSGNSGTSEQNSPNLYWKFANGDQFRWNCQNVMNMEVPFDGQIGSYELKMEFGFLVTVKMQPNGWAGMLYQFDQLRVKSNVPEGEIDYDSTRSEAGSTSDRQEVTSIQVDKTLLLKSWFDRFRDLRIEAIVEPSGKVRDMRLVGDWTAMMRVDGLISYVQQHGLDSLHTGGFVRLPDKRITDGMSWEDETEFFFRMGTIAYRHVATCAGHEIIDGTELLRFDTVVEGTPTLRLPVFKDILRLEDKGGTGVLYFNEQEGHLVSYHYESHLEISDPKDIEDTRRQGSVTFVTDSHIARIPPAERVTIDAEWEQSIEPLEMWREQFAEHAVSVLFALGAKLKYEGDKTEQTLVRLDLSNKRVGDEQLMAVTAFPSLRGVFASGTQIGDEGAGYLAELQELDSLDLSRTRVTDVGLNHLRKLRKLRVLNLEGTAVTDAGLEHIVVIEGLERLWLGGTQVTDAGVDRFRSALPNCAVIR